MAEPHLDHPGEMSWFVGHGPAPVLGQCPHPTCEHLGHSVIAWGPDAEHYELVQCDTDAECAGACRGWTRIVGHHESRGDRWVQVDLSREQPTTRENRRGFAPTAATDTQAVDA